MKTSKVLLNVSAVICFLYGALYLFSLVFIPVGVYCFLAGKRFSYKAEHMYDTYTVTNQTLKNYSIFVSVACFPLGLLSLIPLYLLLSNKIKVSDFKVSSGDVKPEEDVKVIETSAEIETVVTSDEETDKKVEDVSHKKEPEVQEETEEEKLEKLKKLENFKAKGVITEEEFEMAKEQLFGKKD